MIPAILLMLLVFTGACSPSGGGLQVAGAASLRDVLREAAPAFEEAERNAAVGLHFTATGVLLHQALEGAPFDVVVFAGEPEMDRLERAGRIEPDSRVTFAVNRLVVAVPPGGARPRSLEDLTDPAYRRIAMGTPATVPAGRYARESLENAGLWESLEPRVIFAGDVRQVVAYVSRGEADAGFIYRTDLAMAPEIDPVLDVDRGLHSPIRYTAAAVRGAADPVAARRFAAFLAGPRAEVILRRHGFEPPS